MATARGERDLEKWALMVRRTRDCDGWRELERLALLEADESRNDPRQTLERLGLVAGSHSREAGMGDRMLSLARRYGVAVSAVALALLLTLAIPPVRNESPTALFFAAVMVSSWYGGLEAGLLATALATGAINYFIMPQVYAVVLGPGEIVRISVFLLVALLISSLNALRR